MDHSAIDHFKLEATPRGAAVVQWSKPSGQEQDAPDD
jgi:hypothetical protein